MTSISQLVEQTVAKFRSLPAEQKERMDYEQRRTFVLGLRPSDQDDAEWEAEVNEQMPPRS